MGWGSASDCGSASFPLEPLEPQWPWEPRDSRIASGREGVWVGEGMWMGMGGGNGNGNVVT